MKRSKIFLGVTTALLAVAGIAAAKHSTGTVVAYYVTHAKTWCFATTPLPCTLSGTQLCKYTTANSTQVNTFTLGPAGSYNPLNPVNCIHALKYNGIQ